MRIVLRFAVLAAALILSAELARVSAQGTSPHGAAGFWLSVQSVIQRYLGRPYVWGASGLKSFDCSGFVWRVMLESGILVKRTTARKYYMRLPRVAAGSDYAAGNVVFFDNLKHCGIVSGRSEFYHAQTSKGTNLSHFDPYWRRKISGFRAFPQGR